MSGGWLDRPRHAVFCAVLLVLLPASAARADKRVALVIGNSAYQNGSVLATAVKDAKAMAEMFRKAGYDVADTADADNAQFKTAVRQFDDAAAKSDVAVVYFAGYGVTVNGVNYLAPVDAKLASDWDAEDELVPLDRFVAAVVQAKRLALIILDASGNNPLAQQMKRQRPHMLPGLSGSVLAGTPNALIAYAAKEGSATVPGEGDHSPYAAALLHNLFVPGLDVRLAFGRVLDEVLKATGGRQEPVFYGALGGGVLALVSASTAPPAPSGDADAARTDYRLIDKINTRGAWEIFLAQHPDGCYADLARSRLAALAAGAKGPAGAAAKNAAATDCDK